MLKNIMIGLLILVTLVGAFIFGVVISHDENAPRRTSICSTGWLVGETPETVTVTCRDIITDPVSGEEMEVNETKTVMSYEQYQREGLGR